MADTVKIVFLIAVPLGLWVVMLRAPRWFSFSIHRHRLWRLRDQIADDMICGRLPKSDARVRDLLDRAEDTIAITSRMHMAEVYAMWWATRNVDSEVSDALFKRHESSVEDLPSDVREGIERYRQRLELLMVSSVLLGSWIGILTTLRFLVPAIRSARREGKAQASAGLRLEDEVRVTLGAAADRAATESWLGQRSREWMTDEPEVAHLTGVA